MGHVDGLGFNRAKRSGEALVSSSPKHQRVSPSTSHMMGFARFAVENQDFSSVSAGPVVDPTSSSSYPGATFSIATQLPLTRHTYVDGFPASLVTPSGELASLTVDHLRCLGKVVDHAFRASADTSPAFLPARAGSAPVPSDVTDFQKGLGNCWYAPRSVIRFREDGLEPSQARNLVDTMTPPILSAISQHKNFSQLVDEYDLHAFQAITSGATLRRRATDELEKLSARITHLESELSSSQSRLEVTTGELEKERSISSTLEEGKKKATDECASLRDRLETLSKEKEDCDGKLAQMTIDLNSVNVTLSHRNKDLTDLKTSLQSQIDVLKDEVSTERNLKVNSIARVVELEKEASAKGVLLNSFSEFFKKLLDHPQIKGPLGAFNTAAIHFGQHDGALKNFQTSRDLAHGALKKLVTLGTVWNAKDFPIVNEVATLLSSSPPASIEDVFALISPAVTPTSAVPPASASSSVPDASTSAPDDTSAVPPASASSSVVDASTSALDDQDASAPPSFS